MDISFRMDLEGILQLAQLFLQLPSSRLPKSTCLLSRFGLGIKNLRINSILEKDIFYYAATT